MSRAQLASDYISSSNTGMKNRIINGDMSVWQRGTSFNSGITTITYTADRWIVFAYGAAVTASQATGDGDFKFCLSAAGAAGNTNLSFSQRIESANTYCAVGTSFTVKARLYSTVATNTPYFSIVAPNVADTTNSVAVAVVNSAAFTLAANTWTDVKFTFTSTTATQRGIEIVIVWNTAVLAGTTVAATGVQLELGAQATPFERRLANQELAMCQRYFYYPSAAMPTNGINSTTLGTGMDVVYVAVAHSGGGGGPTNPLSFPVTMRTTPVMTYYGNNTGQWFQNGALNTYGTMIEQNLTPKVVVINGPGIPTAYQAVYRQGGFTASAEL